MSKFAYKPRSAETVSARSKQTGGSFDSYVNTNLSFLKVKEGQNDLRILPPTWDTDGPFGDNWGIEIYLHRDIGPDKGAYLCLDKMREKYGPNKDFPDSKVVPVKLGRCPLCAARHDVPDDDADALKALKPGKQILAYVINRDNEKDGPLVWRLGWQLERDIQLRSQDKKSGAVINIDHPDRGYDISFTREGAGLKTKYMGVDISREDSPLHEKQVKQDKWLDFITDNPLNEQLVFFDAEYLEQVYMGKKGSKATEDEEEDDRPTRTSRKPREEAEDEAPRRRRGGSEESGDPTDDEPAPRRRRAEPEEEEDPPRRRRAADPEEDDLPDDRQMARNTAKHRARQEEEEQEDPPRRRRAAEPEEEEDDEAPRGKAADRAKESMKRLQSKKR